MKAPILGSPCKHGGPHSSDGVHCERYVDATGKIGNCIVYTKMHGASRYAARKPEYKKRHAVYYAVHKDAIQSQQTTYRELNKTNIAGRMKEYAKKNPEKIRAYHAKRRAAELNATPPWLTPAHFLEMEGFYQLAQVMTAITGTPHEVDHIYPLQGKPAKGLHVPWNLQVITEKENIAKHNHMPSLDSERVI